jgi:hypothetical protein
VAIAIETGEHELDKDEMRAARRLRRRVADPQIWLVHVTLGYLHRIAGHGARASEYKVPVRASARFKENSGS